MTITPAEIIQALLTQDSNQPFTLPSELGEWPLYVSALPDGQGVQENAACVYDTEGTIRTRLLASRKIIETPGVQIKVRALSPQQGRALLQAAAEYLDQQVKHRSVTVVTPAVTETVQVDTLRRTSTVGMMGQDERRRSMFSVNYEVFLL